MGAIINKNKTFYADDLTSRCMDEMPRRFSASLLIRHMFKKLFLSDDEWRLYISDSKSQILDDWIIERFKRR
jgi:hypothetical protein